MKTKIDVDRIKRCEPGNWRCLFFTGLLLTASHAAAGDDPIRLAQQGTSEIEKQDSPQIQSPETKASGKALEIFVPSEQISADKSVSFPVDI